MTSAEFDQLIKALVGVSEETEKLRKSTEDLAKLEAEAVEKKKQEASQTKALRDSAKTLRAAEDAHANRYGGQGMGMDRLAKFSGADKGIGALAAGPAGLAAAGYMAVTAGLGKAAQAMDIFGNSTMTSTQKVEAFAKEFIPGAAALIAFRDAALGIADKIRKAELAFARSTFGQGQRQEMATTKNAATAEVANARANADSLRGLAPTPEGKHDRATMAGERAFQDEQRRLPLLDATKRAEAQLSADQRKLREAQTREDETRSKGKRIGIHLGSAKHDLKEAVRSGNKAQKITASRTVQAWSQEAVNHEKELKEQEAVTKERANALGMSESGVRKSRIASQKEDLGIHEAKTQRMKGDAQRLGGMSIMDRQRGLMAARMVKQHGIGAVAPEIRSLAEGYAPDWMSKEKEKFGENTAEGKAGRKEGFFDDDKEGIRGREDKESKMRAEVKLNVILDEQALAEKISETLEKSFGKVIAGIERRQAAEEENRKAGEQYKNAHQ